MVSNHCSGRGDGEAIAVYIILGVDAGSRLAFYIVGFDAQRAAASVVCIDAGVPAGDRGCGLDGQIARACVARIYPITIIRACDSVRRDCERAAILVLCFEAIACIARHVICIDRQIASALIERHQPVNTARDSSRCGDCEAVPCEVICSDAILALTARHGVGCDAQIARALILRIDPVRATGYRSGRCDGEATVTRFILCIDAVLIFPRNGVGFDAHIATAGVLCTDTILIARNRGCPIAVGRRNCQIASALFRS